MAHGYESSGSSRQHFYVFLEVDDYMLAEEMEFSIVCTGLVLLVIPPLLLVKMMVQ